MSAARAAKDRAEVANSATLFKIVIILIVIIITIIVISIIIQSTSIPLFSLAWPLSKKSGARGKMTPSTRCIT